MSNLLVLLFYPMCPSLFPSFSLTFSFLFSSSISLLHSCVYLFLFYCFYIPLSSSLTIHLFSLSLSLFLSLSFPLSFSIDIFHFLYSLNSWSLQPFVCLILLLCQSYHKKKPRDRRMSFWLLLLWSAVVTSQSGEFNPCLVDPSACVPFFDFDVGWQTWNLKHLSVVKSK